jgi:SAM-dependent methyltransferase
MLGAMAEAQPVYHRSFDPEAQDSLAKVARLIAPGSLVLDVGCGPGVLGEYLGRERNCTVDGIEHNLEAAALARRSYHKVLVGDLETFDFEALKGASYDYIVCADVLEHLRQPEVVVRQLTSLLSKNGRLILSIPNVAYAGLIAALLNGEFRYRGLGLLDATHLRFFTRKSLLEWLAGMGLSVVGLDVVRVELADSEFSREGLEGFAPALQQQLLSSEDALTYQFIVQALPAAVGQPVALEPAERQPAAVTFLSQLFWRTDELGFDERRSTFARPSLGVDPQRVRFKLPALPTSNVSLRLDVADRPGYVRLYDVAVYDADGHCLWKWDATRRSLDSIRTHQLTLVDDQQRGSLLMALGDDPWLELPFSPSDARALANGGTVEVDLGWPMSTDSLAVARRFSPEGVRAQLVEMEEQRDRLMVELAASKAEQRRLLLERNRFERDRAVLEVECAQRGERLQERESELDRAEAEVKRAHEEIGELRAGLEEINQSLTFRLGRPVFAVVNRLKALRKDK